MSDDTVVRAFVAVEMPSTLRRGLSRTIEQLSLVVANKSVRWVREENIHLTLRFIGYVRTDAVESIHTALMHCVRNVRPFELRPSRLGCFPGVRSPKVLWIGIDGAVESLNALQDVVRTSTQYWGKAEDKPFHPHLTLGRVTTSRRAELNAIGTALTQLELPRFQSWRVDAIHLMQSQLAPGGSVHNALATAPLVP